MKSDSSSATRRTVIVAGTANLAIAIVKVVAGLLSSSSSMLAEAAHSAADTLNQVFLLTSIRRGNQPADTSHPFGYGQERYFWSLLAAFGIFVAGGGFSVFEGILALSGHESGHGVLIAYLVLAAAAIGEGTSFIRAFRQVRGEARRSRTGVVAHVQSSPDTTVKAALFEDTAAIIGLLFAAGGLAGRQITGSPVWDGAGSIAIGALLITVAVKLGYDSRELLIGRAADPREQRLIRAEIEQMSGVDALVELLTMHLGPDHLLVAARVDFGDQMGSDGVENLSDRIDRRLSERLAVTPHVFIDPTSRGERSATTARDRSSEPVLGAEDEVENQR